MADQDKPRVSNVVRLFVPGLAIGLLVGGVIGAYLSPKLDAPSLAPIKAKGGAPAPRPGGRAAEERPAGTGPTGSTGSTGASGPSSPEPAPK